MAKTRKQLQEQRNKAVVAQRQAKNRAKALSAKGDDSGWAAVRKAAATTKALGDKMRARVAAGDKSKADNVITVKNVDEYVDSSGKLKKKVSGTTTKTTTKTTTPGGVMTIPSTFKRTRGGYDPSGQIDYTNTNPAYWNSVVSYYKANPRGNPNTGELGIWIPNLEKEGAERTALAAIAGGVTAHVGSNYSNNTIDNAWAQKLHRDRGDTAGAEGTYNIGGAEKAIRLAGVHRDGTDATDRPMGSTATPEHGVYIKGGKVVKGAGIDYVKGGGDFGGLLKEGDSISGDWLTRLLGPMDSDGMRIGGTYPAVRGATGSGVGAGGTKTSVGGLYSGGADPFAKMPGVADYTAYMDPNSMFGGLSDNAAVRSGLLYQPTASDYGAKMEAAGMPSFSPGLLGSFSGAGSPTYGSTPGSFMKPTTTGGTTTGGGSKVIGDPTGKYAIPEMMFGYKSSLFPKFHSYDALTGATGYAGGTGPWSYMTKGGSPAAIIGPSVYTWSGGGGGKVGGGGADGWSIHDTYDPVKTT